MYYNYRVYVNIAQGKEKEQGINSQAIMMVPLTTVSKGRGLHLLLGRDDVVRTFAVGFWYMSKK